MRVLCFLLDWGREPGGGLVRLREMKMGSVLTFDTTGRHVMRTSKLYGHAQWYDSTLHPRATDSYN